MFGHTQIPGFLLPKVQFVMPKATAKQLQGEIASGSEGIDRVIDALSQVRLQQLKDGTVDHGISTAGSVCKPT